MPVATVSVSTIGVLLLAARILPGRTRRPSRTTELAAPFVAALLLVGVGGLWLASFPLSGQAVITTSDFTEYCTSVSAELARQPWSWSPNRSRLSGAPAIAAARFLGVADALLVSALAGQALLGAGLYLWGRALHSPLAGFASVVCACALAPVVLLGRMLTFYPVIVGTLTLATGLVAVAWRWPGARTSVGAGLGIGLALLVDLRGLAWALPLLGVGVLGALRHPRSAVRNLMWLAAPIVAAWYAAPWAYPAQTTTLEVLSDLTKGWRGIVQVVHVAAPATADTGYIWGRSPLHRIPHTLLWLAEQGQKVPPSLRTHPLTAAAYQSLLAPLEPLLWSAAGVAGVGLLRRPGRLVLLAATGLPFAVALEGAIAARFAGLRFLGNGAPVLAVIAGVGVAVLAGSAHPQQRTGPWASLRGLAVITLLLAIVLGGVSSTVSPLAPWRGRLQNAEAGLTTACPGPLGVTEQPELIRALP